MFDTPDASLDLRDVSSPPLDVTYLSELASRLGLRRDPDVLILTSRYDLDASLLQVYLNANGYEVLRLDSESFPSIMLSYRCREGLVSAYFRGKDNRIITLRPQVVVYRHFAHFPLSSSPVTGEQFAVNQRQQMARSLEDYLGNALWINRPKQVEQCGNRLLQLHHAHASRFHTPSTLITNDRAEAEDFLRVHGTVIAKAIDHHAVRSTNMLHNFYGALITTKSQLCFIDQGRPVLLQEYIQKASEIRVYVVEGQVVAFRIESRAGEALPVDMHTRPLASYSYSHATLPPECIGSCRDVTAKLGLFYAAIDLVQTDEDDFIFLEANPGGDWAWVESQVGIGLTQLFANVISTHLRQD
jgi:glutathione synthase/RimK-type ligase-like ATP-grasp enzyme